MGRTICPDCEARVPRAAAECPRCGHPLRPDGAGGRRRVRKRDVVAVVLACVFIVLVSWLTIATLPESPARARQRQLGVEKALVSLRIVRTAQQRYHRANGRYAGWVELFRGQWPSTPAESEARWHDYYRTSADGQAFISVQRWFDHGAECAEVIRNGPETAASRALDTGSWKNLVPNAPPRCRKVGFPWAMLHWAGVGYLDDPEMGADG